MTLQVRRRTQRWTAKMRGAKSRVASRGARSRDPDDQRSASRSSTSAGCGTRPTGTTWARTRMLSARDMSSVPSPPPNRCDQVEGDRVGRRFTGWRGPPRESQREPPLRVAPGRGSMVIPQLGAGAARARIVSMRAGPGTVQCCRRHGVAGDPGPTRLTRSAARSRDPPSMPATPAPSTPPGRRAPAARRRRRTPARRAA